MEKSGTRSFSVGTDQGDTAVHIQVRTVDTVDKKRSSEATNTS